MKPHDCPTDMPVTDAHRHQAFEIIRPAGCTYTEAMELPQFAVLRRVIEAKAHDLRTAEWLQTHQRSVVRVPRVQMGTDGHPMRWTTQTAPGPYEAIKQQSIFQP